MIGVHIDADKPELAIVARLTVVLHPRSSAHFDVETRGCNNRSHGLAIICRDPNDARLLFVRWEEYADAVKSGRARGKFSICTTDQVVYLPGHIVSLRY